MHSFINLQSSLLYYRQGRQQGCPVSRWGRGWGEGEEGWGGLEGERWCDFDFKYGSSYDFCNLLSGKKIFLLVMWQVMGKSEGLTVIQLLFVLNSNEILIKILEIHSLLVLQYNLPTYIFQLIQLKISKPKLSHQPSFLSPASISPLYLPLQLLDSPFFPNPIRAPTNPNPITPHPTPRNNFDLPILYNIQMQRWIERNIIFPRIHEASLRSQRSEQEEAAALQIIAELKRNKVQSHYHMQHQPNKKKHSLMSDRKFDMDEHREFRSRPKYSLASQEGHREHSGRRADTTHFKNILELLEERKDMFHSTPIRKHMIRLKSLPEEPEDPSQPSDCLPKPVLRDPTGKSKPKKKTKGKIKTQAFEQMMQRQEMTRRPDLNCFGSVLSIKQVKQFDFIEGEKPKEPSLREKEASTKLSYIGKQRRRRARDELKITSIRGWNVSQEQIREWRELS